MSWIFIQRLFSCETLRIDEYARTHLSLCAKPLGYDCIFFNIHCLSAAGRKSAAENHFF